MRQGHLDGGERHREPRVCSAFCSLCFSFLRVKPRSPSVALACFCWVCGGFCEQRLNDGCRVARGIRVLFPLAACTRTRIHLALRGPRAHRAAPSPSSLSPHCPRKALPRGQAVPALGLCGGAAAGLAAAAGSACRAPDRGDPPCVAGLLRVLRAASPQFFFQAPPTRRQNYEQTVFSPRVPAGRSHMPT